MTGPFYYFRSSPTEVVGSASSVSDDAGPVESPSEALLDWLESPPEIEDGPKGLVLPWELVIYGSLGLVAAVMRLWNLGADAIHHDESLHAFFSWQLFVGRGFDHNPLMHGPFQFHANSLVFFLFGDSDYTARLLYAVFGIALVFLPYFFRRRLGRAGALVVAGMLAFSPAMLYFSRFARNDILMAVWTLALAIVIWRYLDERKPRYLYLSAGLLALAYATKETVFIVTVVFGGFLLLLALSEFRSFHGRKLDFLRKSPAASILSLLATLALPFWSASISLFQDSLGLVLANEDPSAGPIGAPSGLGYVIAVIMVVGFLAISTGVGLLWNWRVWLRSAAIFYSIGILLYTTVFTNLVGVGTGTWQSLGYWIAQQDVRRGAQPWYYYFMITSVYEFLPFLFALVAAVYYLRKRDRFSLFLVWWSVGNFFLYSMAGEKMPWLLVNVTLPLILLAGKFLGDLIQTIPWRQFVARGGLLLLPGVVLFLLMLWRLVFFELDELDFALSVVGLSLLIAFLLALLAGAVLWGRRVGARASLAFSTLVLAGLLFALTFRAGWIATYEHGDVSVEMLVYTQTSPDIARVTRDIGQLAEVTGDGRSLTITVDTTDGFSWPWAWYLRDYNSVGWPCYSGDSGCTSLTEADAPNSSVVLVNARNHGVADPILKDAYEGGQRIKHRWWFPEGYKGATSGAVWDAVTDRSQWRKAADYFLYRKMESSLGSVDTYLYYKKDLVRAPFLGN